MSNTSRPAYFVKQSVNRQFHRFILIDTDSVALARAESIIRRKKSRHSEIMLFSTAKEAIEYMVTEDFTREDADTVVLADLHMPDIDGLDLLDRMGNTFEAMKDRLYIFFFSDSARPDEVKSVLSHIYVIWLFRKPISSENIGKIIDCFQYPL
jgi:CheY-like chemotaxis protein